MKATMHSNNEDVAIFACLLGCKVFAEWGAMRYEDLVSNDTLAELYKANAESKII